MNLLGYTLRSPITRQGEEPQPDPEADLLEAVAEVNRAWDAARAARTRLSLWIDWSSREVIVNRLHSQRVPIARLIEDEDEGQEHLTYV